MGEDCYGFNDGFWRAEVSEMARRRNKFDILIAEGVDFAFWERDQSKAIAKGTNFEPDENKSKTDDNAGIEG